MRSTTDYADNTDKVVAGIGDAGSKAIDLSFWMSVPSVVSVVSLFRYNWCLVHNRPMREPAKE